MLQSPDTRLILASASSGRAMVLKGAGLSFTIEPADIDEHQIRKTLYANDNQPDPKDVAEILARVKAEAISSQNPDAMVIGADQVLALGGKVFDKPSSMEEARDNLLKFRGRTHHLHAAVIIAKGGHTICSTVETASLTMRNFSSGFLGNYLAEAGENVMTSVGAYRLEEQGIHLFEKIEGDYFTILGMPVISLLDFLRTKKLVMD